jgi:hypothetical protein
MNVTYVSPTACLAEYNLLSQHLGKGTCNSALASRDRKTLPKTETKILDFFAKKQPTKAVPSTVISHSTKPPIPNKTLASATPVHKNPPEGSLDCAAFFKLILQLPAWDDNDKDAQGLLFVSLVEAKRRGMLMNASVLMSYGRRSSTPSYMPCSTTKRSQIHKAQMRLVWLGGPERAWMHFGTGWCTALSSEGLWCSIIQSKGQFCDRSHLLSVRDMLSCTI